MSTEKLATEVTKVVDELVKTGGPIPIPISCPG